MSIWKVAICNQSSWMAWPLTIVYHLLSFRWKCGGAWHVCRVLSRSQGSHGFVPWQGLWNWGSRFPPPSSWGWLSARSPGCCFLRHGNDLNKWILQLLTLQSLPPEIRSQIYSFIHSFIVPTCLSNANFLG